MSATTQKPSLTTLTTLIILRLPLSPLPGHAEPDSAPVYVGWAPFVRSHGTCWYAPADTMREYCYNLVTLPNKCMCHRAISGSNAEVRV